MPFRDASQKRPRAEALCGELVILSAVTVSLVPEARGGPFVFWDDLGAACRKAGELRYDAVEIFPSGPEPIDAKSLRVLLEDNHSALAAGRTGAEGVEH